ncbi:MAG: multicopper oxidase family protein [Rhizobiaceae bacterium]
MLDRRQFLKNSIALGGALSLGTLATPASGSNQLVLTAEESDTSPASDSLPESRLWLYNQASPGPEIRVQQGETVRVRLVNKLPEATSIHWHGIRIINAMDGVSGLTQDAVPSGQEFEYEFVVPDAGTYWYHAHNRSWNQVTRGLYGPLIVEEPETVIDRVHDLTLVIDDWRLTREGRLDLESLGSMMDWSHAGRLGNFVTINGASQPTYELKAGQGYRVRLINASNARTFIIDPSRFGARILALDGQPVSDTSDQAGQIQIGSGQRVDLFLAPTNTGKLELETLVRDQFISLALFNVVGNLTQAAPFPRLPSNKLPEPDLNNARRIPLEMTGGAMGTFVETTYKGKILSREDFRATRQLWAFNGVANLAKEPLFSAKIGETIIVEARNQTAFQHAIHLHGHHFQVLQSDVDGTGSMGNWRDTFLIEPNEQVDVALVADNPGKWLFHCHMLEHAAAGMNTWFEVV